MLGGLCFDDGIVCGLLVMESVRHGRGELVLTVEEEDCRRVWRDEVIEVDEGGLWMRKRTKEGTWIAKIEEGATDFDGK